MVEFSIVVAVCKNLGIGLGGGLPWHIPGDMAHFKRVTTSARENSVIMGRRTWLAIPPKFRPLASRKNIVVSSTLEPGADYFVVRSLAEALALSVGRTFLIGGAGLFSEALTPEFLVSCSSIYLTRIAQDFASDVFFPAECSDLFSGRLHSGFSTVFTSKTCSYSGVAYDFCVLANSQIEARKEFVDYPVHEEYCYLGLVKELLSLDHCRENRTGVPARSVFGRTLRFDLSASFPLLTTKSVFWRGVVEELLWFISGSTNSRTLSSKGVKIWDPNGGKEFLSNVGLGHREEGDLGPVYGFQWRHFGAEYQDMHTDYTGQGMDQLKTLISTLRTDPSSRRMVLSAWNPPDLHKMALPPCHVLSQFYVNEGKLSCLLFQRSADLGLGVPFNIASYSLLCCLIAAVCGLGRGEFIHVLGDAHVYETHIEPLQEQLRRAPSPFPVLRLSEGPKELDDFTKDDILLEGYIHSGKIPMDLAV